MHFHLATVLILIPLLTAAPTPNIEQRQPADVTDTLKGALGQLTGGLGKLPTGNGKRADITKTVTNTLGQLTGALGGGLTKLPGGKRQVPDIAGKLTEALKQITGGDITKLPTGGKREAPADITETLTSTLGGLTGSLTKLPGGGKREAPADITETLTSTLGGLTGGLAKLPGGKRQAPDVSRTLMSVVDLALGQGNEVNPKGLLNSRESVDVGTALLEALKLAKPITNFPNGKRDSIDIAKAVSEILDPVNGAFSKDYSKDFKFPDGAKKPNGKRNDGIDVTKTVGQILSPFSDALGKDYSKDYKIHDDKKTPSGKRGGIDGTGAVAAVLGQITGAIENSKGYKPDGLETPSQSHKRQGLLAGLLGKLTGGLGGLKPPGSGRKRQDAADATNAVPLAGALLQLAEALGGGALKDGKVPEGYKLPDGFETPSQTKQEKRIDVASAAKGVIYEVIDGVTKPTKNL
ncbi:hypothetical protein VC83_00331 [Pseudogymnoascus destructans]|uniref:Uncharacterized protein n=2 Tax=Pseudogymnoascus destructans TaxID=655981 RepID=L8G7C2_PSED2|nr:uncharacterized protein VC83_00331 [Pseudogymnoascus destructans]ELR08764.1 hypothetical protein GMDG_03442 [Pseudogymnoascus destructans 20631-21]OAF63140.1 hypothetical protein VC83_00331 [Pseudogymnoascus destructans]